MKVTQNKSFLLLQLLVLMSFVVFACVHPASADFLKLNPPPDVDKAEHGHWGAGYKDSCWVTTAANMLAGAGYGDGNTVQQRADEIYDEMCNGILDCNKTGWTDTALLAWLRSDRNTAKQTNPYKYVTVFGETDCKNTRNPWRNTSLPEFVGDQLRACSTIQLSILRVDKTKGHSITAWGDDLGDTQYIDQNPARVKVSDSDYADMSQNVQTYNYDDYNNPNPGGGNQGVGWYFNYAYSDSHRYIDNVTVLGACSFYFDPNEPLTIACTKQYTGSYKIHQADNTKNALGLNYKVFAYKMFWYRTSIDWDTNNAPQIWEINDPPRELRVSWNLSDNPVPFCNNITITTTVEIPWVPGTGVLWPVTYEDVNFAYFLAFAPKPGVGWGFDHSPAPSPAPEPNQTGGHIIGSFEIYADQGGAQKLGEYRLLAEYDYSEHPEYHLFRLKPLPQTYFVGKFRFGHSYASLEKEELWQFTQWLTDYYMFPPYPMVNAMPPIAINWAGAGLLPYPKGQDFFVPTAENCGDPGTIFATGDVNKDCKVDWQDFAQFAATWLVCTEPNQADCP